jgi:hypothetical protein
MSDTSGLLAPAALIAPVPDDHENCHEPDERAGGDLETEIPDLTECEDKARNTNRKGNRGNQQHP